MDYTEYTAVKSRFATSPNLCDLFKLLSIETWKRIEYAYLKQGVKVFETTITQNLIFSINAYNDQYGLSIDIFEALDEKTNGNDLELIIRFPREDLEYYAPIQAKKVHRNGRYSSMDHGVQIQSLMDYATANDARPLYLLYNFASSPLRHGTVLTTPIELTGCSLISVDHLFENNYNRRTKRDGTYAWLIPHFYDLNPDYAFAWHELVCSDSVTDFYKVLSKRGIASKTQPAKMQELIALNGNLKQGFYPINTFTQGKNWVSNKDLYVQQRDEYQPKLKGYQLLEDDRYPESKSNSKIQRKSDEVEKVYPKFSPKSRIIINK